MVKNVLCSLLLALSATFGFAQVSTRPQILVVGTFHMANPGRDLADVRADDMLQPKRQQEIAELVAALKKFAPTKIAVEAEYGNKRTVQEYANYLAGKYTLSSNEIDQIGFRLAKEMNLKEVYPVDVMEDFPWQHVVNWAKANGADEKLNALMDDGTARINRENAFLHSHSVLETLAYINSDGEVAEDVGWYYRASQFGDPYDDAGSELLTQWFKRNIEIYNNIHKLIETPNDRVLVIYGSGHLGWLRQNTSNDPSVRLSTLDEFSPKP